MNTIDTYDKEKLEDAKQLILEVYDYNYKSKSDSLGKKLMTIVDKIDKIIAGHYKPRM